MKKIDYVMELLQQKANYIQTAEDKEKYDGIVELLAFDNVFSKMGVETAIGLLDFIGVPEDQILKLYTELVAEETLDENKATFINIGRK